MRLSLDVFRRGFTLLSLIVAALCLLSVVYGVKGDKEGSEAVAADIEVDVSPEKPFVLPDIKYASFFEGFQRFENGKLVDHGWVLSIQDGYKDQQPIVTSKFSIHPEDSSLVLDKKHARYGLSKKLDHPIAMDAAENIVIQFEGKFNEKLSCSGGYIKFIAQDDPNALQTDFEEKTPYVIMFGPDRCGGTHKIHAIFKHQNPISKEIEEKHMTHDIKLENDKITHVYTLRLNQKDQTATILVDNEVKATHSALVKGDFKPNFLPDEEIDDPEDKKPATWVDEKKMPDPDAKKPADWVDEKMIVDPGSVKPSDWDDEEDGEWEPVKIPNPEYKGEWQTPMIDNPKYKGEWKPKQIRNPNFFLQDRPFAHLPKISHVFIEVLANDEGIAFDNIVITSDITEANDLAKHGVEKQIREAAKLTEDRLAKKKEEREKLLAEEFSVVALASYAFGEIQDFYETNPAIFFGGAAAVFTLVVLAIRYVCCSGDSLDITEDMYAATAARKKDDDLPTETEDDTAEGEADEGEEVVDLPKTEGDEDETDKENDQTGNARRRPRKAE